MLVIIKNAPDTPDGTQGMKIARDMGADLICLQNGVYFAQGNRLEGFLGIVYVLDEDLRLRGLSNMPLGKEIKKVDYEAIVDLMAESEKTVGMF